MDNSLFLDLLLIVCPSHGRRERRVSAGRAGNGARRVFASLGKLRWLPRFVHQRAGAARAFMLSSSYAFTRARGMEEKNFPCVGDGSAVLGYSLCKHRLRNFCPASRSISESKSFTMTSKAFPSYCVTPREFLPAQC